MLARSIFVLCSLLLAAACATTAPPPPVTQDKPPPLQDMYEIKFPQPPGYELTRYQSGLAPWGEVDVPMHRFGVIADKVAFTLSYATIPTFHERSDPKSLQRAVEASIKELAGSSGFRVLASEQVNVTNADFAKSFVGAREGLTVSGIGCAAGDRIYMLMTEHDQTDSKQVSASRSFVASFRP